MDLFDTYGDCAPTIIVLTISSASSLINWLRDCGFPPVSRGGVEGFGALKLLCLHCSATAAHSAC